MIHVCFSLYDKTGHYSKFLGTTMLSLFENTSSEVTVHILHDNTLTNDNREKLIYIAEQYHQFVKFYNVAEIFTDKIAKIRENFPEVDKTRFSVGMFYRFFIPYIFPAEMKKAIYLDADIIVNLDINKLWQIELEDHPLAVILETDNGTAILKYLSMCRDGVVKEEDYFNSGVLLMNLPALRGEEESILEGIKFIGEHPKYIYADQDILNYCFSTRTLRLPVKFNRTVKESRNTGVLSVEKEIYHYAGGKVGLGLNVDDPFNRLWWSYFIKTPWFDVDTIDKIFKGAANYMSQLPVVSPDKTRAFIVDEEHACQIERNFSVRDAEEVIVVDNESEESLERLTKLISDSKGRKIFFIGIPNIDSKMLEMRFVRGKDFFNVSGFYSPIWADLTSNYNLILSM